MVHLSLLNLILAKNPTTMATTKNNWSTDRISNVIISNLITYNQEYPWHLLIIYSSLEQFEQVLPKLITSQNKVINIIIMQDDCSIEFNTDTIDQEPNLTFIADDITFKVYSKA